MPTNNDHKYLIIMKKTLFCTFVGIFWGGWGIMPDNNKNFDIFLAASSMVDPDTSTHVTQSLLNESDSIYSGDQSIEEFQDINSITGKLYRCEHCRILFEDCTLYLLHNGFHSHDADPFKCVICRLSCRDRIEFNCHLISHIK